MSKDSLVLHFEYIDEEELTTEEVGILTLAMIAYVRDGVAPELKDRGLRMLWKAIKSRLDADAEAYEERCRINRENGKLGGRPRKETEETEGFLEKPTETERFLEKPKKPDIDIDIDSHIDSKEKSKPKEKAPKRFTRPTVEEVKEYCQERNNTVDPERFIDFYESVGWKVGNKPMKDWRAAVRTWEKREDQPRARSGTTNKFKNFEERTTDLDRLEAEFYRMQDEKLKRELYG